MSGESFEAMVTSSLITSEQIAKLSPRVRRWRQGSESTPMPPWSVFNEVVRLCR